MFTESEMSNINFLKSNLTDGTRPRPLTTKLVRTVKGTATAAGFGAVFGWNRNDRTAVSESYPYDRHPARGPTQSCPPLSMGPVSISSIVQRSSFGGNVVQNSETGGRQDGIYVVLSVMSCRWLFMSTTKSTGSSVALRYCDLESGE